MDGPSSRPAAAPGRYRLRRARLDDVASLAQLQLRTALVAYAGIFPPESPVPTQEGLEAQWRERISSPSDDMRAWCIVEDVEESPLVGCGVAEPDPDRPHQRLGHLSKLYVRPDRWGRGLGRRLHDAAVADLVDQGYRQASLLVLEGNTRAQALYVRWGWRWTGERQPVVPGVDDLRFERALDAEAE